VLCKTGDKAEIASCTDETCPLFPFRMGKHPEAHALSPKRLQAILSPSALSDL
jgi:hypothetical protein